MHSQAIVLIGAGNVASQLGMALQEKGFFIAQVYSRTLTSARTLGDKLQADYTDQLSELIPDAGFYIFAVKDSVLPEILNKCPALSGLWVHTAGSVPMNIFSGYTYRYGVLYPLQTFSKDRKVSFAEIPFFIEACQPADELLLETIARALSGKVVRLSSEKRKQLHLAAVFACNFTNHLYTLAARILEENGLPFDLLQPLIRETAAKIETLHPKDAQTGPAVRYDENIINQQLEMLKEKPPLQEIYRLLSGSIHREQQVNSFFEVL
jgi:predicted short-subunit dehydrogenase-like oxidoreductase (DUF2520 family)